MGPWCFVSPRFEKQLACKVIALSLMSCFMRVSCFSWSANKLGLFPVMSPVVLKIS